MHAIIFGFYLTEEAPSRFIWNNLSDEDRKEVKEIKKRIKRKVKKDVKEEEKSGSLNIPFKERVQELFEADWEDYMCDDFFETYFVRVSKGEFGYLPYADGYVIGYPFVEKVEGISFDKLEGMKEGVERIKKMIGCKEEGRLFVVPVGMD